MFYKAALILSLFLGVYKDGHAQFNLLNKNNGLYRLRIYLGENSDSVYISDAVRLGVSESELSAGFFDYRTGQVKVQHIASENKVVHDGIILPAASTDKIRIRGFADFGNDKDSCSVDFEETIDKNTNGRSALLSVLNAASFFSDPSAHQNRQPDPYRYTKYLHEKGTISANGDSSVYLIVYHRSTGSNNLSGWLVLNGDTLNLKIPPLQKTHSGKLKKTKHLKYDPGVIIIKDDKIYAALDFGVAPLAVYLRKDLSEMQQLKIAAYLYTILNETREQYR